jgi:peptidoglycan/LPS O-acetylase OafA/YrhL
MPHFTMFGRGTPTATPSFGDAYDRRRNNFDVLRFGLAASVIWSHCYALAGRSMDPVFAFTRQIDAGSLAVQAFFVLSGFLITQSWLGDPDLRDYTVKRALRLVPALLAALVFGALVVGPLMTTGPVLSYLTAPSTWAHFDGVALHRHLASPLLFGDNPVPHQLNASLWSLRYEMLCYALVALIGVWRGARATVVIPLVLATALVAQVVLGRLGAPAAGVATTLAALIGCFFAGAALYVLRDRVPFSPMLATGAAAALVAAGLVGGLRVVFPLAGTYLLLFAGCWRGLPLQGFGRYGDFSYGLYVFAYPIQQAIVQHAGTGISIPVFFVLAFVATLVLAILSWHFIEAPSLARKPRWAPVRVTAPSCPTGAAWPVTSPGGS